MIFLQTLGGATVTSSVSSELGTAALHRGVLALLAVATSGRTAGVSRDRAMGLLWPEASADRARHSLSQTLYKARTALRSPELFLPGNDVRLNPAVVSVDVWELEGHISAGRDADAVELYHGPFLDGFFLSASVEFEEWVSSQRRELSATVAGALERLASKAEAAHDLGAVVEWRRRLAAADPLSSRAALRLMEAHTNAGDSAAALIHAEVHRRAVRALLDTEPDGSITAFETRLRVLPVQERRDRAESEFASGDTAAGSDASPAGAAVAAVVPAPARSSGAPARRRRIVRITVSAAAAAVAAIAWLGTFAKADTSETLKRIVVAPFRVSGAETSLAYLREGMVDLLAARLSDASLTHAVEPGVAMAAWRRVNPTGSESERDAALRLAKRVGATGVIVGSVVGSPSRLYVTAALLTSPGAARDIEVSAHGPADSLTYIVDRLAGELLAARYGESDRLATRVTSSLPALRAYLIGQAAYRRGEYSAAARDFDAALRADSQFALAGLQLALASDRINDGEQDDRALTIAWTNRAELSERDRAHLVAFAGPQYPQPSSASASLEAWESALQLTPDRSDIWYEYGERMLRQGHPLGLEDGARRAMRAFTRALELDPSDREGARPMLILAAARLRDTATIRHYASEMAVRDSMGALSPFVRWTVANVTGDRPTLARMRTMFPQIDDENLRLIAMASLYDGVLLADGERAANILSRRPTTARGLDVLLAQHAYALNAADAFRALDVTEQIEARMPGSHAHLRLRILDALYGNGNRDAAVNAAAQLERVRNPGAHGTARDRAIFLSDLCVREQWRLETGDRSQTRASVRALEAAGYTHVPIAIGANPHTCAALLTAWLAVDERAPNARQYVLHVDSLMLEGPASGDAATYAHILLARLHDRLRDGRRALTAVRRRSYLTGWPRYLATASYGEAVLANTNRAESTNARPELAPPERISAPPTQRGAR